MPQIISFKQFQRLNFIHFSSVTMIDNKLLKVGNVNYQSQTQRYKKIMISSEKALDPIPYEIFSVHN